MDTPITRKSVHAYLTRIRTHKPIPLTNLTGLFVRIQDGDRHQQRMLAVLRKLMRLGMVEMVSTDTENGYKFLSDGNLSQAG